jgi:hypothetical protein
LYHHQVDGCMVVSTMAHKGQKGTSHYKIVLTLFSGIVVLAALFSKKTKITFTTSQERQSAQNVGGISSQLEQHSSFVALSVRSNGDSNLLDVSDDVAIPALFHLISNTNDTKLQMSRTTANMNTRNASYYDIYPYNMNNWLDEFNLSYKSDLVRNDTDTMGKTTTGKQYSTIGSPDDRTVISTDNGAVCRVYMAPSTIPGAGYGLFAGIPFQPGDLVTPGDGVVPIYDPVFQNGNVEHENTFLWDEYVWSASTFSAMDIPGKGMEAASFGVGALNVEDSSHHGRDNSNLENTNSPGLGAFSPWYDRKSYATRNIRVGSELFVDYGYSYFTSRMGTIGPIPFLEHYKIADKLLHKFSNITNHRDKTTDDEKSSSISTMKEDLYQLIRSVFYSWQSRVLYTLPSNSTLITDVLQHGGTIRKDYLRSIRNIDYLKVNGACMDHLYVSSSKLVPHAGRGVYTSRPFAKGSIVTTVPLIHIPERKVMTIFEEAKIDIDFDQEEPIRNTSNPVHQQLLLNYCFGHKQSTLLLCPYGIVSSLINHAPSEIENVAHLLTLRHNPKANVQIQWSTKFSRNPEWWSMNVSDWAYSYRAGLAFEYVALRDIDAHEEIFVDYGVEWQIAWEIHVANWVPIQRLADSLNADLDSIVPTEKEWMWQHGDINIQSSAVNLWCYNTYRELQGLPGTDALAYPCKVVQRRFDNMSNSHVYVAEIVERRQNTEHDTCDEIFDEVLWTLPRDAFSYGGFNELYDTNQYLMPSTFRHEMSIPDSLMPQAWKNSK